MKYFKFPRFYKICTISILTVSFIMMFIGCASKPSNSSMVVNKISPAYQAEVKNPEWSIKKSELIIIGKLIGKAATGKGRITVSDGEDVVYTDTSFLVTDILKDKTKSNIKVGDEITVRTLGGTFGNLTTKVDVTNLFKKSDEVLLCLANGTEDPTLPNTIDKKYYCVVGGIHGSFDLNSDGKVKRTLVNDDFKLNDLKALIKSTEKEN